MRSLQSALGATVALTSLFFAAPLHAQDVGVPACDKMLKTYETCVIPQAGAAQAQLKTAFSQMRANWLQVAATPEGKKSLEPACVQVTEQMKTQLAAMKCSW